MCFLLRCLVLYESNVGVMRKDDGLVGVVGERVDREGVMRGHVWKGRVRVEGWHWLTEAIANNQK